MADDLSPVGDAREEIDVEQMFQAKCGVYVLRVRGDSMINDHLCDGDYVVIERRPPEKAKDGDTVVALLDTGAATLRRFFRTGENVTLRAANATVPDQVLPADRVRVQGVMIGVLRSYN